MPPDGGLRPRYGKHSNSWRRWPATGGSPDDELLQNLANCVLRGTEPKGAHRNEDSAGRHTAGVGGSPAAAALEREGADPGQGRAGRGTPADAVAGGREEVRFRRP